MTLRENLAAFLRGNDESNVFNPTIAMAVHDGINYLDKDSAVDCDPGDSTPPSSFLGRGSLGDTSSDDFFVAGTSSAYCVPVLLGGASSNSEDFSNDNFSYEKDDDSSTDDSMTGLFQRNITDNVSVS